MGVESDEVFVLKKLLYAVAIKVLHTGKFLHITLIRRNGALPPLLASVSCALQPVSKLTINIGLHSRFNG